MALTPYVKIRTNDEDLATVQERVDDTFRPILNKDLLDGRLIKSVSLVSGSTNNVEHGLSRAVNGYIVVKKSATATIWDDELTNTTPISFLQLRTSANVIVDLWVF